MNVIYRAHAGRKPKKRRQGDPTLTEVCPESSSVVLRSEVVSECQTAFHANDAPLHVIHSEPDKLRVDDVGRLCGLPEGLCRPRLSARTGLRRHFTVRGSVGPAVLSKCGFPEGDPVSCVAMTVANIAFHAMMAGTVSPNTTLTCFTFVDNYEALSPSLEGILEAHQTLQAFSKAWDMPVDSNKTVFFCTHTEGRAALRASGLTIALDFRDLGAHLQTHCGTQTSHRPSGSRLYEIDGLALRLRTPRLHKRDEHSL